MEFEIVPFDKELHGPVFRNWYEYRKLPPYRWDALPHRGFTAIDAKTKYPIACVTLRLAEWDMIIVDQIISNPHVRTPSGVGREMAKRCMAYFSEMGAKIVVGWTELDSTVKFAKRLGFVAHPATLLLKED